MSPEVRSLSGSSTSSYAVVPDGGYGWMITFASFMCHFVADGLTFSFGVIYDALLEEWGASKSATSWIGSVFVGVPLLSAPLAGLFVNRYGCRAATIFGGIVAALGLFFSSYANSVELMTFTYGIVSGFGLAFVYVPSSVIPSFWFEKKRSLATGVAVSGSGIGTFAMAPLMEFLLAEYGWRGTMLILSGITLNIVVFGALFRPVPEEESSDDGEKNPPNTPSGTSATPKKEQPDMDSVSLPSIGSAALKPYASHEHIDPINLDPLLESFEVDPKGTVHAKHHHHVKELRIQLRQQSSALPHGIPLNQLCRSTRSLLPISRRDVSAVLTLAERQKIVNFHPRHERLAASCPELSMVSDEDSSTSSQRNLCVRVIKKIGKLAHEMCDVTLFCVPVYLFFFISNFLLAYAYDMPYVYLPNYASDHNVSNGSFLIAIIGLVNTFGQILYGYFGDRKEIDTIILYGTSIAVTGVLVAAIPLMTTFAVLAVFSSLFGFFISANFSLETIVIVKVLSLDQLTKAYSLLMFGQGVASLIGPPIGGLFWDLTHTYTFTFVFSGVSIIASGFFVLAIKLFKRKDEESTEENSPSVTPDIEAN